ncbi:AAA domain-containing protein [Clostridium tyrobutyricum]|uniref:AAA domain-containing protein n=1 Tax=Clostridium tyrobutyricum TaxID=1519 RepID=UPI0039F73CBB
MHEREKIENIFSYLLSLKNLNEKTIKDVYDYERVYWEEKFLNLSGCIINKNSANDSWIEINEKSAYMYDEFFKLYQESEKRGENFEIICGSGLICWEVDNEKIRYPLLETRMRIEFNNLKKTFALVPSGKTKFQSSIFEDIQKLNINSILDLEDKINNMNLDPRVKEDAKMAFSNIIACISKNGKIEDGYFSKDKVKFYNFPVIYNTFVIFVRKNNMRLWQVEINNILKKVREGYPIPETIKALVQENNDNQQRANKGEDMNEWKKVSQDVLFPLPANSEQKEIIKRISENYGVVMQGPPGTGKSQTIVNLVCHLLAHGKRILVTSQTDRALRVLIKKIPENIRPLCISLLGNDAESFKELSDSVRQITNNLSLDPKNMHNDAELLREQLKSCIENQKILYRKLKEVQALENETINYDSKKYTMVDIAKWVNKNSNRYSWIEDDVNIKNDMPISNQQFDLLTGLLGEVDKEQKLRFDSIKSVLDKFPENEKVYSTISNYKKLKADNKKAIENLKDWYIPYKHNCNYDELLKAIYDCRDNIIKLKGSMWEDIFKSYHQNEATRQVFKDVYYKSSNLLLMLTKISNDLRNHKVELPEESIDKFTKGFEIVYRALDEKKKIGRLFKIVHPECGYIFSKCTIDDRLLSNMDQAFVIKLFLQKRDILRKLKNVWINTMKDYGFQNKNFSKNDINILDIQENFKKLKLIVEWNQKYKVNILANIGKIVFPKSIDLYDIKTYDYLIECVNSMKNVDEYNEAKVYLNTIKKLMRSIDNDVNNQLESGNISEKLAEKLSTELKNIKEVNHKISLINDLTKKLSRICPNTTRKIVKYWDQSKNMYKSFEKAWQWSQWNNLLNKIGSLNPEKIEQKLEREKAREKLIIKELVAKSTWYNQIVNTKESQKRSLFSWMQAVKRIGKGRGKMVSKYRKIAQNEMEKCKEVIPVWIMPLNRVIENIKLNDNLFDVIIFDESSQSDIFSLCGLMRAKRAVIVGDDKQISPEVIGVDQKLVSSLIEKYLKDIPDRQWFDLQTSLYDTALRVFPNRLMLKEHFRCVPEIIRFSNDIVYSGDIKPLRYPSLRETFNPPINAIKVDGKRDTRKPINNIEAEAIADKITECCKNKKYNGMSMGVISLLGEAQGNLIETILRRKIGVKEMINRRIVCGDAYSFQGDERDVMFLSMVISNNVKFAPLSRDNDMRRFNVAASRARNQMWLFYSVNLEDLSEECIRYSLLNYCLNYNKYSIHKKNLGQVFQSDFQKDVYTIIKNAGYRVKPQIKIGKYNIDFMIEGSRNRVAIICDGDELEEKYNFKENIERQLDLERVGWTFLRIRGSEFYLKSETVMNKIFNKLDSIGIKRYRAQINSSNSSEETKNLKAV